MFTAVIEDAIFVSGLRQTPNFLWSFERVRLCARCNYKIGFYDPERTDHSGPILCIIRPPLSPPARIKQVFCGR